MSISTNAEMHAEHRLWSSEHAMWRDDIELWRKEHQQVLADLTRLVQVLKTHDHALAAHLSDINTHQAAEQTHERALAGSSPGNATENLAEMAAKHQAEAYHHRQQREAHERIKKHHHSVIARCSMLFKAIPDPM